MEYTKVNIVIQARSTSKRFPGKIFEKLGAKQILQHVIDQCSNSADYINAYATKHGIVCGVTLAVPQNDSLVPHYSKYQIVQGPEDDVLARYVMALDQEKSDYVVRITSDCPLIPPYLISRAINLAVRDKLDFLTNAHPRYRTAPDGHDVEVLSARMLRWLGENVSDKTHREHVTSYLHDAKPEWAKSKIIVGFFNNRNLKLSVDTREDLDRLIQEYNYLYEAINACPGAYRL